MADYSYLDKFLHRIALASPAIGEAAFDLEKALFLKSAPPEGAGAHVFVTGLARSGTTILLREIHRSGQFGSLAYADMPFVLASNGWAAVTRRFSKSPETKTRAHGDGIAVDTDSPEALDEVFWRVMAGDEYIGPDALRPHTPDAAVLAAFDAYIRLILRRTGRERYLSKNNNNILRLPALMAHYPHAIFLIPVRKPLAHAMSLLSMHKRFSQSEPFTRNYMTWLAHHEFGATHRPFRFSEGAAGAGGGDPDTLEYWLGLWLATYRHLYEAVSQGPANAVFVPYEQLCTDTAVWNGIAQRLRIDGGPPPAFRLSEREPQAVVEPAMLEAATGLYEAIAARQDWSPTRTSP